MFKELLVFISIITAIIIFASICMLGPLFIVNCTQNFTWLLLYCITIPIYRKVYIKTKDL